MPAGPSPFDHAVASRAQDGGGVSGDLHVVRRLGHRMLVAVVDGLGHGHDAEAAARMAIATIESEANPEIIGLVHRCDTVLSRSRGAVMSIALLDAERQQMTWLAVGNVEGVLIRAGTAKRESILMRGGIVGHRLP